MEPFKPIGAIAASVTARLVPITPRYPAVAHALAYHLARRVIEDQWRARGLRIRRYADIIEQAREYRAAHPELLDQAAAIVQRNPTLSAMAAQEERQLEREQRKRARAGVIENPCRSVTQSGSTEAGTEKTQEFSTTSAIFGGS
jgi:hypothetical protein